MHTTASLRRLAGAAGLGLLAAGLVGLPGSASANPAGTDLVITEAYLNGGSANATYTHKYVELHNPTATAIDLTGLSLQYRSATGTGNANGVCALTGSIAPGDYFVVQGGSNGAIGAPVPAPDQLCTAQISPGGGGGQIFVADGTTAINPGSGGAIVAGVRDLVGYGSATTSEGAAPAPTASVTTSIQRTKEILDTDNNATDFTAAAPTPGAAAPDVTEPPPPPVSLTIAQIQGTGAATPVAATQVVITRGVVTAAYPSGGFNGFYLQTGGADTTPGASDGIFVFMSGYPATIEIGDSVEVEGLVKEFSGLTEIEATRATELETALPAVEPNTVIPGTDCALPGTGCLTGAALDAAREEVEGEVFLPTAPVTVTDAYDFGVTSSSFFGEIGLAFNSTSPLVTPTEVIDAQDTAGVAARTAYNQAHLVVLDDGSSTAYWNTANNAAGKDLPVPWLTAEHTVRVGASVTFAKPVVLDYRFGWKLQPQRPVVGVPTGLMTFEQDRPAKPANVGGDLKLATFNVLNYFTTLGGSVAGCTAFVDRTGDPVATNRCSGANGPRGAWEKADFDRQQVKIVKALNTMDADIVSLEELENSKVVDGTDRDEALASLVAALNADAGAVRWAYAASPAELPASEDVIRTGFIYDPSTVELVGASKIFDAPAFDNAREPLAQVFRAKGSAENQKFAVIVNHFKSKGSGVDDGTGQGNANPDRIAQAKALTGFATQFATERGIDKVFLTGDFNSYSEEDPVQEIKAAGYTALESTDDPAEESYSFAGTSGSLDHVFANPAARAMVTGVDIWETNANEPLYFQYSRYNYVGTLLYSPDVFASSDHNPEIVGLKVQKAPVPGVPTVAVTASVTPERVVVKRTRAVVHAKVQQSDGKSLTSGTVEVLDGTKVLASAQVGKDGVANVRLPVFTTTGERELTVRYVATGVKVETTVEVRVLKRASQMRRATLTKRVKAGRTVAVAVVKVRNEFGNQAHGKVRFKVRGTWHKATLREGKARLVLGVFPRAGKFPVVVKYAGNKRTSSDRLRFKVRVR